MNETEVRFMLENRADIVDCGHVKNAPRNKGGSHRGGLLVLRHATTKDRVIRRRWRHRDTNNLEAEREYRDCLKSHSDIQFLCETENGS